MMTAGAWADEAWTFDDLYSQTTSITETMTYKALTLYATSSAALTPAAYKNGVSFGSTIYYYGLKTGGTGGFSSSLPTQRVVEVPINGACKITIHCQSQSSTAGTDRTLVVDAGTYSSKEGNVGTITAYQSIDDWNESECTLSYSGSEELLYVYSKSSGIIIYGIYIDYASYTKTIPSYKMVSFSTDEAVSVPDGVTVYKATSINEETITLTEVEASVIPANTGVILNSETEGDITLEESDEEGSSDLFSDNLLVATSETPVAGSTDDGYTYYGLNAEADGDEAEFGLITAGTEFYCSNKAYLKSTTSGAKSLKISFSSTTGISEFSSSKVQEAGTFYNLQGVRVQNPQKGLYIQDGKKVLIK